MATKGTSASARTSSKSKTTTKAKSKPKTTKKAAANSTQPKKRHPNATTSAQSSRRRSQAPKRPVPEPAYEPMDPKVKTDILLSGILLLCALLFISNLGISGKVGRILSSVFFGLFGIVEYAFPFCLFFVAIFVIANSGNTRRRTKLIGYFLFFIFVCAFLHLMTVDYQPTMSLLDYYKNSAFDRSGGGLCGGLVVFFAGKAFGTLGCWIITLFGLIITACIMTQRPLVSETKERGLLAHHRISAYREKAVEKSRRRRIPFDEDESHYDEPEEGSQITMDQYLDHAKQPAPTRRHVPMSEKVKTTKSKKPLKQPAKAAAKHSLVWDDESFHDSFLFDISETAEHEREAASNAVPFTGFTDREAGPATVSFTGDRDRKFEEDEISETLTINRSEGAGTLEQQKDNYNPYAEDAAVAEESESKKKKKKNARSSDLEIAMGVDDISEEIAEKEEAIKEAPYKLPPIELLTKGNGITQGDSNKYLKETALKLEQVMRDFGVNVQVTDVSCGPSVTRYEVKPEQGVKVSRIVNLADDIKLNLAASNIRIEAPIPGKAAVGIEVPNKTTAKVLLRNLLEAQEFTGHPSKIAFAVGKDIAGKTVVTDIAKMPHLLIAGATGSGKSVCINTLIMSILYKASPEEVKLIMIDPKVVELSVYNGIPHLAIPVVTDPKKAAGALNWAVAEMSDRYNKFAEVGVRDVASYNARVDKCIEDKVPEDQIPKKMPQIVIVVDELADLMMVAPGEVEDAICRLAQLARAAGIHLIIATQRPSVNVVTGLIKANMPSRIALSVASGVDSRTILDMNGAEKLLGHGDMLFYPQGYTKPARVQGAFVSDDEIANVVQYLTDAHGQAEYDTSIEEKINSSSSGAGAARSSSDQDELFIDAAKLIIDKDKASIGMLQRAFKIGFNRAARIMDQLCEAGVVGEEEGTKPRKVLMSVEMFENYLEDGRL